MPTQRFYNLKEEKKKVILDAAIHEFSRVPYSSASINQIIKEANISRGSFYTYFQDKEDLLSYLVRGIREQFRNKVFEILEETEGDLIQAAWQLFEEALSLQDRLQGERLYRNTLSNMNLSFQNRLLGIQGSPLQNEFYQKFIRELYERLDRERFPVGSLDRLSCLIEILYAVILKAVSTYYLGIMDRSEVVSLIRQQLEIIKEGAFLKVVQ